jgi:TRAP-type uncharacterized transport system fused permease subunit
VNNSEANTDKKNKINANDLVIENDSGARRPRGIGKKILFTLSLTWALFQLWISSPLPYYDFATFLNLPIFNSTEARLFHLSFALGLTFFAYPAFRSSPRRFIPFFDWIFGIFSI